MKPRFTVLSREYCSLCDKMVAALEELQGRFPFTFEVVDVDADPALEARWNELVPVLLEGGEEVCHHRLDRAALDARLARIE